jgi:hypothetical protein
MSSTLTQPLDPAILSDIAAGLACSCAVTRDEQDEFEGIEREGPAPRVPFRSWTERWSRPTQTLWSPHLSRRS